MINPDIEQPGGRFDNRAVSRVLGYVLTLGVSTLLVSGLLIGVGGFVEDQRERTVRNELEVIGEQLAADLTVADQQVRAGRTYPGDDVSTVTVDGGLPERVTGVGYSVTIRSPGTNTLIELSTEEPDVSVTVGVYVETDVVQNTVTGGSVRIVYDTASDELVIRDA